MRILALIAIALLAGCAAKVPTETTSDSATSPKSAVLGNKTSAITVVAPIDATYNKSVDLTVTYASPVATLGTNFAQNNCLQFNGSPTYNGTATLTWTAGPSSASMELVATLGSSDTTVRLAGASPLTLPFSYDSSENVTLLVSVQSDPTGAVAQQAVHLEVTFTHPADASVTDATRICAY